MISVFNANNTTFKRNGNVVLMPTKCTHRQAAAGKYDLTMEHPIDPDGKWMYLAPEAVIRAPVPEEIIETAYSGQEVDVYLTTTSADLRSGPSEPTTITYTTWSISAEYAVGAKVTWNGKNYQCNYYDETSPYAHIAPPSCPWWVEIANKTAGSPLLVTLKRGTELYYISGPTDGWYKMSTTYGLEGYIKASQVQYDRHLTPSETQPRHITTQLFRIKTVTVDSKSNKVTVTAEHVSYDMSGILVEDANIQQKKPAEALALIQQQLMMDYQGTIATNMTANSDGKYTGEIKGKNLTYALLDPDKGIVAKFRAMYRRDNWDVFVMRKTNENRGFQLRYGKNMLGVNWKTKTENLVTRVVPVAKAEDGKDLYLDLDGHKWVDSDDIGDYPVIRMERLKVDGQVGKDDGTRTDTKWTETTLRAHMQEKAEERFSVDHADQPVQEITIDFEMLGDTAEYPELKNLQQVLMYDQVEAINAKIGLYVTVEVSEIEYDCIRQKITALKLTNVNAYQGKNVSGYNVFNNSITKDKLTDDVSESISADAVDNANDYTDTEVSHMNSSIRAWVTNNFVHN